MKNGLTMPLRRLKNDSQQLRQWLAIETYSGRCSDAHLHSVPKTIPVHKNDNNADYNNVCIS